MNDGEMPTLVEAVARELSTLKADSSKVSAAAISALQIAELLDGGEIPAREQATLRRELRLTMDQIMGSGATADAHAPTDEFTERRQARHQAMQRGGGA